MDSELNSTGGSTQLNTETPQASTQGNLGPSTGGNSVQPDSTADLFSGGSGVSLSPTSLPAVNLGTTTSTTASTVPAAKHNFNATLLIIPLVLIVIAAATVIQIQRSANNTTE